MYDNEFVSSWKERGRRQFRDFEAVLTKLPEIEILEWKNKNGSCDYRIRFLFDEKAQSMTVTGDLGTAVFVFTEPATFDRISRYTSLDYFFEKMKASTDEYYYVSDKEIFLEELEKYAGLSFYRNDNNKVEIDELIDTLWDLYGMDGIELDNETYTELYRYCDDIYEWIGDVGKRIHPRVILWLEALHCAREALEK